MMGLLIQDALSSSHESESSLSLVDVSVLSKLLAPNLALIAPHLVSRTSSGRKSGLPMMARSDLKSVTDFCRPPFQYQSPGRSDDSFGYGPKES